MRSTPNYYWFEQKPGEIVRMSDGTEYKVDVNGWRKVKSADRVLERAIKNAKQL